MRKRVYTIFALFCILTLLLSSCGLFGERTLSGTYRAEGPVPTGFTFSGNTVTMTAFGFDITDAEYEIKDGEIVISYDLFGLEGKWRGTFSRDGDSITVNGVEFKKQ